MALGAIKMWLMVNGPLNPINNGELMVNGSRNSINNG